jgi:hypothetical protein
MAVMKNFTILGALLALLALSAGALVACGGDDDDPLGPGTDNESNDDGDGDGEARGVVTIGETTYEFVLEGSLTVGSTTYSGGCNVGVSASGRGYNADGVRLAFELPPVDWETNDTYNAPPEIEVSGTAEGEWTANARSNVNETVGEGTSVVGSWEFDGSTVRGTATFFAPDQEATPGDFEIICP